MKWPVIDIRTRGHLGEVSGDTYDVASKEAMKLFGKDPEVRPSVLYPREPSPSNGAANSDLAELAAYESDEYEEEPEEEEEQNEEEQNKPMQEQKLIEMSCDDLVRLIRNWVVDHKNMGPDTETIAVAFTYSEDGSFSGVLVKGPCQP